MERQRSLNGVITKLFIPGIHCAPIAHVDKLVVATNVKRQQTRPVRIEQPTP